MAIGATWRDGTPPRRFAAVGVLRGDGQDPRETLEIVAPPVILHLLPVDLERGAQTYARDLRRRLDGDHAEHRTMTLFRSPNNDTLAADYRLDVPNGRLRGLGVDPRVVLRLRRRYRDMRPPVVVAHGGEPLKYAVLAGIPRRGSSTTESASAAPAHGARGAGSTGCCADGRQRWRPFRRALRGSPGARGRARSALGDPERPRRRTLRRTGAGHAVRARCTLASSVTSPLSKRPERFVEVVRALYSGGVAVDGIVAGAGPLRDTVESRPVIFRSSFSAPSTTCPPSCAVATYSSLRASRRARECRAC